MTFSSTDSPRINWNCWNTKPKGGAAQFGQEALGQAEMSRPSRRTRPLLGRVRPPIRAKQRGLAGTARPAQRGHPAGFDAEVDLAHGGEFVGLAGVEGLADLNKFDHEDDSNGLTPASLRPGPASPRARPARRWRRHRAAR
jgi:hypothetical protein